MARVAASHASLVSIAMLISAVTYGDNASERTTSDSAYLVSTNGCKFLNAGPETVPPPSIVWSGECVDDFVSGEGELIVKDRFDIVFSGQFEKGEITRGSVESRGAIYTGEFKNNKPNGNGELVNPGRSWSAKGMFEDGRPVAGGTFEMTFPNGKYVGEVNTQTWLAEGKGVFNYRDGGVYEGMMRNNIPHGTGESRTAAGEIRKGTFVDGNLEGKGSINWADGTSYEGELRVDKPHGLGAYKYASGATYQGDFVAGDAQGKGKMTWPNGDSFEGDFLYGRPHGRGIYHFHNGMTYEGDLVSGHLHGQGRIVSNSGVVKEGEWKQGKLHGKCLQSFPDGERYEGVCADDFYHGQGHLERAETGEVYDGEFRSGEYDGKGVLRVGGHKFEGTFKQGMKEGFGKETDESGGEYEGNYSQNLWHGSGTLRVRGEDGTLVVYEGQFEKGAMHGAGKMTIGSRTLDGEFRNNEFARGIVSEGADRFEVDLQLGTVMQVMPDGSREPIASPKQGI